MTSQQIIKNSFIRESNYTGHVWFT